MKKLAKANKKIVLSDYPVDEPEDVLEFYLEVFSGYKGRWVLVHILKDLYFLMKSLRMMKSYSELIMQGNCFHV